MEAESRPARCWNGRHLLEATGKQPPQPIQLKRLNNGRWHLLRLGKLSTSRDNAVGYDVKANFQGPAAA